MPKNIFIVDSCDEEETQIFHDIVPAETPELAQRDVEQIRDYAVPCETLPIKDYISWLRAFANQLEALTLEGAEEQWNRFIKEEDHVRLKDGNLVHEYDADPEEIA